MQKKSENQVSQKGLADTVEDYPLSKIAYKSLKYTYLYIT